MGKFIFLYNIVIKIFMYLILGCILKYYSPSSKFYILKFLSSGMMQTFIETFPKEAPYYCENHLCFSSLGMTKLCYYGDCYVFYPPFRINVASFC